MRKNYFYLAFLCLLFSTISFAQKVTLTPTVVNGTNVNTGPINLGFSISSTVSLSVKVETPVNSPDNGTINIYYERSSGWGANIPTGGNGGNLFFGGGKIGLANFVIYLSSADFNLSGGNIYAEYKSFSGVTYKSSNIAVTKNDVPTPPPPMPNKKFEILPHGGTPILPKFTEYENIASQNWINSGDQIVDAGSPFYVTANLREKTTFKNGTIQYSKQVNIWVANFMPELDNLITDNKISSDQYLTNGQSPQMIIGNEPFETHTVKGPGSRNLTVTNSLKNHNIQWQTRIKYPALWSNFGDSFLQLYGWIDIPGATKMSYLPPQTSSAMEYRRVIIENIIDKSDYRRCTTSNVVSIVPVLDNPQNTICCDQSLQLNSIANPIIGSNPNKTAFYQWQVSSDEINWKEIFGATDKDLGPKFISILSSRGINEKNIQSYRRNVYSYSDNQYFVSNINKITFLVPNNEITVYPNPATSTINIKSEADGIKFAETNIKIANITGIIVNSNNFSIVDPNLVTIDISNLVAGTYFINIETYPNGRRNTQQFTFIKN